MAAAVAHHVNINVLIGAFFVVWLFAIAYIHNQSENGSIGPIIVRRDLFPGVASHTSKDGSKIYNSNNNNNKPPMTLDEICDFLSTWISQLHEHLSHYKKASADDIWEAFHNLTRHTLYPWDQEYLSRMPPRRTDGSIFLSVASYRDENCLNTLQQAYEKAQNPDNLYIGLVQQNCRTDCRTGIMEDGKSHPTDPDPDCHHLFCNSEIGKPHCQANRLRVLRIDEPESLGPYMARYFASKLWYQEEWYMQVDAHMTFAQNWDAISLVGLNNAPSEKPILSHYPPDHRQDLKIFESKPSSRICGPIFTAETIRLEGSMVYDHKRLNVPRFAPFTGAGYFVAHSSFLREVPFDPFLPWIFMGEEIILSSRLWTSGYDMFSPAQAVVGHIYFRRHTPKFWESVHRTFSMGVHNPLEELVLERIRYQLGYPEAARDMVRKSVLTAVHQYSMGRVRPLSDYMKMIGMNATTKEATVMEWCVHGKPPPGFEKYDSLYKTDF